jgi:hypothetical protein
MIVIVIIIALLLLQRTPSATKRGRTAWWSDVLAIVWMQF